MLATTAIAGAFQKENAKDDFILHASSGGGGVKVFDTNKEDIVGAKPRGAVDVALQHAREFGNAGMGFVTSVIPQAVVMQKELFQNIKDISRMFVTSTSSTGMFGTSSKDSSSSAKELYESFKLNAERTKELNTSMVATATDRTKIEQTIFKSALQPNVNTTAYGSPQAAMLAAGATPQAQGSLPSKIALSATFKLPGGATFAENVMATVHSKV
jgi:hypothetical protein